MEPCPHFNNGVCEIGSQLAGQAVKPHASACKFCVTLTPPRAVNRVTVSIAIASLPADSPIRDQLLAGHTDIIPRSAKTKSAEKRLAAILVGTGVGSHLWKLLESIGVKHTADCTCLIWAELMNSWGPIRCKEARPEIVAHMKASAKNYGWDTFVKAAVRIVVLKLMFRINVLDPYGSLLDEAIRRAEIAEEPKCASTKTC